MAAGGFSLALTDQNQVLVWGTGNFGTFGTPQKVCMDGVRFTDIAIGCTERSSASAIDNKGALYTWGYNENG